MTRQMEAVPHANGGSTLTAASATFAIVVFDKTWSGSVAGIPVAVELRIQSVDGSEVTFQTMITVATMRIGRSFELRGNAALEIPVPYIGSVAIAVSNWSASTTQLDFDLAIRAMPPFIGPVTLASEHVSVPLQTTGGVQRMMLANTQSPADFLALLQLSSTGFNLGSAAAQPARVAAIAPAVVPAAVGPIDPTWVVSTIIWAITTGGDDRRGDSSVIGRVVRKDASPIEVLLEPGRAWGNYTTAVVDMYLGTQVLASSIDHIELQFTSNAGPFEGSDNWDVSALRLTAVIASQDDYESQFFSASWPNPGMRFQSRGTYSIPFPVG